MTEEQNNKNLEKYADDIATIKSMLMEAENKSIIEPWAFLTWGVLILTGTLIHFLTFKFSGLTLKEILFEVWLPVFITGGFLETIAWIKRMSRESLPFFSGQAMKLWIALTGQSIAAGFIIFLFAKSDLINLMPLLIIVIFASFWFYFGNQIFFGLTNYGYFLLMSAVLLYNLGLDITLQSIICGIILGLTFITAGITIMRKEKNQNE